ncbi:MAG: hypothetical protein KDK70_30565 [Myxococcales bacterium]|nr:hypothetical protein [Myxococcales bacterium]
MLVTGGPGCSCSDRVVGDEPQGYGQPACIWLINPKGFRADGSCSAILDHANYDRAGTACLCLTQEEYDGLGDRLERRGFPEPGTLLEEFNEIAYDECKRLSALDEDGFVDDECLDYYQTGEWLKDIYFARGDWANGAPPGFTCYE